MPKGMKVDANVYVFPQGALRRGDKFMSRALRKPKPEPIPTKRKTRRERFEAIVPRRMAALKNQLILLGNCASSNYQYTQEDAAKIEATLREWIDITAAKFDLLGKCASSNYQYTKQDVANIEETLREWVEITISKFKATPPDLPEFKL